METHHRCHIRSRTARPGWCDQHPEVDASRADMVDPTDRRTSGIRRCGVNVGDDVILFRGLGAVKQPIVPAVIGHATDAAEKEQAFRERNFLCAERNGEELLFRDTLQGIHR